jgi:hypothetical protein
LAASWSEADIKQRVKHFRQHRADDVAAFNRGIANINRLSELLGDANIVPPLH